MTTFIELEPGEGIRFRYDEFDAIVVTYKGFDVSISEPIREDGGHMVNVSGEQTLVTLDHRRMP